MPPECNGKYGKVKFSLHSRMIRILRIIHNSFQQLKITIHGSLGDSQQQVHIFPNPMGIDSAWPTSAIQNDNYLQLIGMSIHPTDIDSPLPTSTLQGDHAQRQVRMFLHSMGIDSL